MIAGIICALLPHHRGKAHVMQKIVLALLLAASLSGCGNFLRVYKADIDQGNVVTKEMVDRLKPGMTPAQVRYVLGTPLITDTLNPKRWDYLYDYVPGTYARKAKVPAVDNRRLTVVFENGILATIEGADAMPPRDPIKPESRDRTLNADPL
jgi:outer membrane protein assembly factor BamE